MRAKIAVAIAALGLMAFNQPSFGSNNLNFDVQKILYGGMKHRVILTQPAVIESQAVVAAPATTVVAAGPAVVVTSDQLMLREIPAVLAPTSTGVAIITEIPSDLDMRREDLSRGIDNALGANGLSAVQATDLKTALGQVGTAEVQMRSDGLLGYDESRRLYKAMDRIGSDLDWYTDRNASTFLGLRVM